MKTDKKPYDSAFKDLADAEALLRLIGAWPPGAKVIPLRPEISAPALITDQPYEVTTATERYIAHLEAQTRWKANVPDRVVRYEAIFWINKQLPVHSYVLVFVPDGMPDNPPNRRLINAGDLTLISEFTIVKLWELSAEEAMAQSNENLLPFIPLMRGGAEKMEQCAQALGQIEDEVRQRALSLHFVSMGSLRYNRDSIIQLLGRTTMQLDHILRETPYIQSIIAEVREEALAENRRQLDEALTEARRQLDEALTEARRQQGEAQQEQEKGRREALTKLLLGLAAKHFPGTDLAPAIEQVSDLDQLEALLLSFDKITDVEMLRARLAEMTVKQ